MIGSQRLFRLLDQEKVAAVLVGGAAMILQGVTHFTNDIDVCYWRDRDNLERLARAMLPLNPRLRVEGLTDAEARALPFRLDSRTLHNTQSLTLMTDIGAVDLLGSISGLGDYDNLRAYIVDIDLDGLRVPVLSLPAIITNKRTSARAKDLAALPHIEATLRLQEAMAERVSYQNGVANQQVEGDADSAR